MNRWSDWRLYFATCNSQGAAQKVFSVQPPGMAYHVSYISTEARQEILIDVEQRLAQFDALAPPSFPDMGTFDERLYPKS